MTSSTTTEPSTSRTHTSYRRVSSAVKTVLVYTISDSFGLDDTETIWVSYQVARVLEPLINARPKAIPLPVQKELDSGIYSKLLLRGGFKAGREDGTSTQASVQDWAQVLADLVIQSYHLRPLVDATIVASFIGILTELGVGNRDNPRASNYLPNAVRHVLSSK